MPIKPSRYHRNRKHHNWLVYDINDSFLIKYQQYYCGQLYDLGCGEAPYQRFFLQYADNYIGVDWAGSAHKIQQSILADLNEALPITSEVADTIVSLSVLEHLHNPQTMINEAYRLLKPAGNLFMQVPWQWMVHEAPHDYYRYTPFALSRFLENAGFIDINIEAQSGFFSTWVLKLNYFSFRFTLGTKKRHKILRVLFSSFWYVGQKIAPYLDKIDKNWQAETIGFFVRARKP